MEWEARFLLEGVKQAVASFLVVYGNGLQVFVYEMRDGSLHMTDSYPQSLEADVVETMRQRNIEGFLEEEAKGSSSMTHNGLTMRETGKYLLGKEGQKVGALLIRKDITGAAYVYDWLRNYMGIASQEEKPPIGGVDEMMDYFINRASIKIGKPVTYMKKEDKKEFIRYLDERGIFQIKKSSDKVAAFLSVSKFTLYTCLEEIRDGKKPAS